MTPLSGRLVPSWIDSLSLELQPRGEEFAARTPLALRALAGHAIAPVHGKMTMRHQSLIRGTDPT